MFISGMPILKPGALGGHTSCGTSFPIHVLPRHEDQKGDTVTHLLKSMDTS